MRAPIELQNAEGRKIAMPGQFATTQHSVEPTSARISVPEIARRLGIGRLSVYAMLDQGIIPGIRVGRRWIITRHAYQQWERTCGMNGRSGLVPLPEVRVLN
jgi:excisionase family DNA binding protein